MPIHPDFKDMLNKMIKQYGKEKGTSVFYAYCKSKGLDYTKPYPGKKEDTTPEIKENYKFKFTTPFVIESLEVKEGEEIQEAGCRKIKGTMLKATTSRNGRTYTMEEIQKAKFTSDTISLNHTEDVTDNVGTFKPRVTKDGIDFEATIYNTGKHPYVTDMIDKGLIKFTSIEAIAGQLVKEGEQMIAKDLDITGVGLVKTPGIPEATIALAEAFEDKVEDFKGDLMAEETIEAPKSESHVEDMKPLLEALTKSNEALVKKYEEQIEGLRKEIDALKESKSKGKVTAETKPPFRLEMVKMKDGLKEFYSPDFLY